MGLGLAHHRMIVLLAPALVVFILLTDRSILKDRRLLAGMTALTLTPLLLYSYIPLRGMVTTSLDGTYLNTWQGFISHVAGSGYAAFITDNPLAQERGVDFYSAAFIDQFGLPGIALGLLGFLACLRRPRVWVLLALAWATNLSFALIYKVADITVFLIPTFLLTAFWIGIGADSMASALAEAGRALNRPHVGRSLAFVLLAALLISIPGLGALNRWDDLDLSSRWAVHDYGMDILSQPLEKEATVVGILGEMTLLRYFQRTEGIRPDLVTIAADREEERLAAVESAHARGSAVYLTRPLPGAPERFFLSSQGPLIRVLADQPSESPFVATPLNRTLGGGLILLGYDVDATRTQAVPGRWHAESGVMIRTTLFWKVGEVPPPDFKVSLRLLGPHGLVAAQGDAAPVHNASPASTWRPGQTVTDVHDLVARVGTPPGDYQLQAIIYRPDDLSEIGRADLGAVTIPPSQVLPSVEAAWDGLIRSRARWFGGPALRGHGLPGQTFAPGEVVPVTLLWEGSSEAQVLLRLRDSTGVEHGAAQAPLPRSDTASFMLQETGIMVPGGADDGSYDVVARLAAGSDSLRLAYPHPLAESVELGTITVAGRERNFLIPEISKPQRANFGQKIGFLGYDLPSAEIESGGNLHLDLYWKCIEEMDVSYTVFIHLLDESRNIQGQRDSVPGGGTLPTSGWAVGEVIADGHDLSLSPGAPPGRYTISIGLYRADTGERLPATSPEGAPLGDHLLLETPVTVK